MQVQFCGIGFWSITENRITFKANQDTAIRKRYISGNCCLRRILDVHKVYLRMTDLQTALDVLINWDRRPPQQQHWEKCWP